MQYRVAFRRGYIVNIIRIIRRNINNIILQKELEYEENTKEDIVNAFKNTNFLNTIVIPLLNILNTSSIKNDIESSTKDFADIYFSNDNFYIIRTINSIVRILSETNSNINEYQLIDIMIKLKNNHMNIDKTDIMLKELNLNKEQFFSMLIQNLLQKNNSKREKDFKYDKYYDIKKDYQLIYINYVLNKVFAEQEKKRNLVLFNTIAIKPERGFKNIIAIKCIESLRNENDMFEVENLFRMAFEVKPGKLKVYFCKCFLERGSNVDFL